MSYKIVKSGDYRERRNFSRIRNSYELKDLLEIQKKSYNWFITDGIKEVFEDLFPVENFSGTLSLELEITILINQNTRLKKVKIVNLLILHL